MMDNADAVKWLADRKIQVRTEFHFIDGGAAGCEAMFWFPKSGKMGYVIGETKEDAYGWVCARVASELGWTRA